MIDAAGVQLPAQPPVRLAEGVVRKPGKQVMQRVIAKAHRSPERRQCARRGDVDAVEELGGDAHRLSVILPQVRDQSPHLVEEHHARSDSEEDQEFAQRHDAGRDERQQRDRPQAARRLLQRPVARELAFGVGPNELGVDLQARIAADDHGPELRRQQR